jgi:hypothetical protein
MRHRIIRVNLVSVQELFRGFPLSLRGVYPESTNLFLNAVLSLALGLGPAVALLWFLGKVVPALQSPKSDGHSVYYVAPSCSGIPDPCFTSVQAAVDAADAPDDVIKIADGVYTEIQTRPAPSGYPGPSIVTQVVYISKTVTIRGGYSISNWDTPYPITQPTTLDARRRGRVLFIAGDISPTVEGLHITGGHGSGLGGHTSPEGDAGGGVYVSDAVATIRDCQVFSNMASTLPNPNNYGGGLHLSSSASIISNTEIYSNEAQYGGGIQLDNSDASLLKSTVRDNWAYYGGGVHLVDSNARLVKNQIVDNDGISGGGLFILLGATVLDGNTISGNDAIYGGGAVFVADATALNEDTILSNNGLYGGGLNLGYSNAIFTNVIVANNDSSGIGCGLYIDDASSPRLVHTVIARNHGAEGSGLYVTNSSKVALTNTILVSHTVGISVTLGSTVTLESTLWGNEAWANGTNWDGGGTVNHTHDYTGTPAFVDPDIGNYHLSSDSAAIDRGVNAGVTTDIDGETRPDGCFPDIGADEFMTGVICKHIYLSLVLQNHP